MVKISKIALFSIMVTLLTAYLSYSILEHRMIGTDVKKDPSGKIVAVSTPVGYWGYGRILAGDIIEEIDGEPPEAFYSVKNYNVIEKASIIKLIRNQPDIPSQKITIIVDKGVSSENLLLEFILPLSAVIVFAGFSIVVYHRKWEDKAAIYLILFFLSTGLAYLSSSSSGRADPLGKLAFNATFALAPVFFLQFLHQYLIRYHERLVPRRLFVVLYWIVGVIILLGNIRALTAHNLHFFGKSPPVLFFFIILNLYIMYKIIKKFAVHRRDSLRNLFKLTLIAHMLGFLPFILLFGVPRLFGITLVAPQIASVFLFTIPAVYLYMFITRKLFDIDFVLNRILYYAILSFIPTLLITTFGISIMNHHNYSWVKWVQLFMVVYLMLTLFLLSKEYIDFRFRPNFNKNLYTFEESLHNFSGRISRVMKRADLERVLEQEILSILSVEKIIFLDFENEESPSSHHQHPSSEEITSSVISAIQSAIHKLEVGKTIALPNGICVVMGRKGSIFHLLWLDDKVNKSKYNLDELDWLKTLANYSAIVYENLYLIESLLEDLELEFQKPRETSSWAMRLIFNLSETERRRLAADLHDSALQDQLIWYRKLEAIMLDHNLPTGLQQELEDVREGLLDVIHQIRETCNEMRPPLLKELGIVEALGQLFEQAQVRSNYKIDFQVQGHISEMNDEKTLTLFRIVQELLRNANKHAKASVVRIRLEQQEEAIELVYKDNGIGMDFTTLNDSYQHMGLSGIQERVRSLEGDISLYSIIGEGLEVHIALPLEPAIIAREGENKLDDKDLVG
ncbi:sensor histidine kinase [Paenibacillus agri]|uniref:histidine kinase n=1 Tax=Paenibacillus agri TaxID=2744309 RepID=A0A850ED45_9BACL|nr:sensor histidine kinase [Paenibacillus agri]NUU59125.1 sensor histidine kinase [Paenibacillus agri]